MRRDARRMQKRTEVHPWVSAVVPRVSGRLAHVDKRRRSTGKSIQMGWEVRDARAAQRPHRHTHARHCMVLPPTHLRVPCCVALRHVPLLVQAGAVVLLLLLRHGLQLPQGARGQALRRPLQGARGGVGVGQVQVRPRVCQRAAQGLSRCCTNRPVWSCRGAQQANSWPPLPPPPLPPAPATRGHLLPHLLPCPALPCPALSSPAWGRPPPPRQAGAPPPPPPPAAARQRGSA